MNSSLSSLRPRSRSTVDGWIFDEPTWIEQSEFTILNTLEHDPNQMASSYQRSAADDWTCTRNWSHLRISTGECAVCRCRQVGICRGTEYRRRAGETARHVAATDQQCPLWNEAAWTQDRAFVNTIVCCETGCLSTFTLWPLCVKVWVRSVRYDLNQLRAVESTENRLTGTDRSNWWSPNVREYVFYFFRFHKHDFSLFKKWCIKKS